MSWPLVSVLMPAYNTEKYIHQAIKSILNQTYKNIEFIIFNDGSIDNTLSIIESYAAIDNRIVVVSSKTNKGYVYHLNHGISIANGKYIARMDSDDISLPKRIENQVLFMEACHTLEGR
jgi:glycosyltransferase involved in cell wall biosynthesis